MKEGYFWYREGTSRNKKWYICHIKGGYVHFFGQVSQEIGNEYLTKCVTFGEEILQK